MDEVLAPPTKKVQRDISAFFSKEKETVSQAGPSRNLHNQDSSDPHRPEGERLELLGTSVPVSGPMRSPQYDNLLQSLKLRFHESNSLAMKMCRLIPLYVANYEVDEFDDLCEFYESLVPQPSEMKTELKRWKERWIENDNRPTSLDDTLTVCSMVSYPNVCSLLQIFAVLPVTVASCERSFSNLKRILALFRSTMGDERLVFLTLMSIHSDLIKLIEPQKIVKQYFLTYKHRNYLG